MNVGDTMCTSGDVQYIGEILLVHWGDVQYIGGCSVHWGMFSTLGDVQYIGGMFSTLGGYHDACGGYHEYIEGCSAHQSDIMMHLWEQLDKSFQFLLKTPVYS